MTYGPMRALLPVSVEVAEVIGVVGCDLAALPRGEATSIASASHARKREFGAGRVAARRALARLGVHDVEIPVAPDRSPVWPRDMTGSITHCAGYVAAAAARLTDVRSIGIDAEPAVPLPPDVFGHVLNTDEVRANELASSDVLATVVFGAKEAVYKALWPIHHRWLEFGDVDVRLDRSAGSFTARVRPSGRWPSIDVTGRYSVADGLALSAVTLATR